MIMGSSVDYGMDTAKSYCIMVLWITGGRLRRLCMVWMGHGGNPEVVHGQEEGYGTSEGLHETL
jgi:hypothetical protein